jgi:prophage antirepressor-like protein
MRRPEDPPARQAPQVHFYAMQFQAHEVYYIFDTQGVPYWPVPPLMQALSLGGNVTNAMRRLDADEKKLFNLYTVEGPTQSRRPMWCVNEAGLYNLILTSRKPIARAFKRWVTHEVLPEIRRTGRFIGNPLSPDRLQANSLPVVQRQHSLEVGDLQSIFGGRGGCTRWYRKSLKRLTSQYPKEWVLEAPDHGLPHKIRGREVVRMLNPAAACAVSLADDMIVHMRANETDALDIGEVSIPVFGLMLERGYLPAELFSSPLDGMEPRGE